MVFYSVGRYLLGMLRPAEDKLLVVGAGIRPKSLYGRLTRTEKDEIAASHSGPFPPVSDAAPEAAAAHVVCILLISDTGRASGRALAGLLAGQGDSKSRYWPGTGRVLARHWPGTGGTCRAINKIRPTLLHPSTIALPTSRQSGQSYRS